MFGFIIDRTCLIWQEVCGVRGSCLLYDTDRFRYVTHTTELLFSMVTLVAGIAACGLLRRRNYAADPPDSYKDDLRTYNVPAVITDGHIPHVACDNEDEPLI